MSKLGFKVSMRAAPLVRIINRGPSRFTIAAALAAALYAGFVGYCFGYAQAFHHLTH